MLAFGPGPQPFLEHVVEGERGQLAEGGGGADPNPLRTLFHELLKPTEQEILNLETVPDPTQDEPVVAAVSVGDRGRRDLAVFGAHGAFGHDRLQGPDQTVDAGAKWIVGLTVVLWVVILVLLFLSPLGRIA